MDEKVKETLKGPAGAIGALARQLPNRYRTIVSASLLVCLSLVTTGCGGVSSPPNVPSTASPKYGRTEAENAVIVVLAKQLGKNPGEINTWRSLNDLGADELDLVEVIMELEEELHISMPDDALVKASGSSKREDLLSGLTVEKLAAVVAEAARAANANPKSGRPADPAGEKAKAKQPVPLSSLSPRIEDITKGYPHLRPTTTDRVYVNPELAMLCRGVSFGGS
jgi:acyl carrier protein